MPTITLTTDKIFFQHQMVQIKTFTFNDFQVNTYVLYDSTNQCVIIDPGCYSHHEEEELKCFIENNHLKPVKLLQTHSHIDHVLGTACIEKKYGLCPEFHKQEKEMFEAVKNYASLYNCTYQEPSQASYTLQEGDRILFGESCLSILFVPGHSPGHVAFVHEGDKFIVGGDVLFQGSIGRTDLPGSNFSQLISSIKEKLLPLSAEYRIFPGHGPATDLATEKKHNPFIQDII